MKKSSDRQKSVLHAETALPKRRMAYLSGAPRVSTRPEAAASGPRAHILNAIRALQKLGWEVIPYIVGDQVPESWIRGEVDVAVQKSFLKRFGVDLARLTLSGYHILRVPRKIPPVSWVYERFGTFQALGYPFARKGVPWVVETNGLFFVEAVKDRPVLALPWFARIWELAVYRRADAIVVISEHLKAMLVEHGINEKKILVVPNAVDEERFNPDRISPIRVFSGPTVGFVGTLSRWQALDLLIRALEHLAREGISYHLVVIGDGLCRAEWEALARRKLGDRARFIGRQPWEEIPRWIAGFDIGYSGHIPTETGPQYSSPLKLYEYMAMERVVLASVYTRDAENLIHHGVNGFLTDPLNPGAMLHTLKEIWRLREQWHKIGARARRTVLEHHTWVRRYQDMLCNLQKKGILPDACNQNHL